MREREKTHAANPGEELPVIVHSNGLELNCDNSNCEKKKKHNVHRTTYHDYGKQ